MQLPSSIVAPKMITRSAAGRPSPQRVPRRTGRRENTVERMFWMRGCLFCIDSVARSVSLASAAPAVLVRFVSRASSFAEERRGRRGDRTRAGTAVSRGGWIAGFV